MLLPEADAGGADAVATRLVSAIAASPLVVEGREVKLAISAGGALFDGEGCPQAKGPMVRGQSAYRLL